MRLHAGTVPFTGVTSILAKCGISKDGLHAAAAVHTAAVRVFSWGMTAAAAHEYQRQPLPEDDAVPGALRHGGRGRLRRCCYWALPAGMDDKLSILTIMLFCFGIFQEERS